MSTPDTTPDPTSFYAKHEKIYPREVHGRFSRLRTLSVWGLLGLYYAIPWLPWRGRPAVLFDLPARKFYLFDLVLWPQDFIFLTWLLILLGLSLFFFTAVAGRLWCGYACPQTVWTEAFVRIERAIEGDRAQRIRLDQAAWDARKIARKTAKQLAWIAFSLWTGLTFVSYFVPMHALLGDLALGALGGWALFWTVLYGFATYGNAGFMREQVCKYMCPYARFQSAMFDRDTLIITYDKGRGEPRGARVHGAGKASHGLGDCVDCGACVQACPTGIDIRAGLQYECIACAACVDACDTVMDRVALPRGLVRYTTQNALEGDGRHVLRPRIMVYATLLALIAVAGVVGLARRNAVALDVIRDRNALYREASDGSIENVYNLRIMNKAERSHVFRLSVSGLAGARVGETRPEYAVAPGEVFPVAVRVTVPAGAAHGHHDLRFLLEATDAPDTRVSERSRFIGP